MAGLAASPVRAEGDGKHTGKTRTERHFEGLKKKLSLTDDQAIKVKAILSQSKEQRETAQKEAMDRLKKIEDDADQKISGVLNEEQKKKFAAMREKREERRAEMKQQREHQNKD
jgi:Spy/CpxP family protein refolding chaperone